MPIPDDYTYDVFFSYKRHDLTLDWTRQVAHRFELWLGEELGGHARMFVDETCIETGTTWPDEIREALKGSKCMVSVWSPSYFQSSWCVSEWKSFRKREKMLNIDSHGLIAPLRFHDGEHFPPDARRVQWVDVAPYAVTVPAFWASAKAIELEERLKTFAKSVAAIVTGAPAFRPDWPIVESKGLAIPRVGLAKL